MKKTKKLIYFSKTVLTDSTFLARIFAKCVENCGRS